MKTKKAVIEYYLTGEFSKYGNRMRPLWISKDQYDYIKKNHKLPKSMRPLKTSDFNTLELKVIKTTWEKL